MIKSAYLKYSGYFSLVVLFVMLTGCSSTGYRNGSSLKKRYSEFLDMKGLKIHYYDISPPDYDKTLLFIHGWMGSAYDYQDIIPLLSGRYRLIVPDLPGCGLSSKKDFPFTVDGYVEFLRDFTERLGISRYIIVAHSMGGHIAVRFIERYRQAVSKLVLIAPDGLKGEEGGWLFFAGLGPLVDIGLMFNTRLFIKISLRMNVFYDPSKLTEGLINSVSMSSLGWEAKRAQAEITKNIIGRDPIDKTLESLNLPVLIIWGKQDKVLNSKWAYKYAEKISGAELVILDKCGHMPMVEKPEKTAALIREFIEQKESFNQPGNLNRNFVPEL